MLDLHDEKFQATAVKYGALRANATVEVS